MDKKVLITGASGLLGRDVTRVFLADKTWSTLGLAFSRSGGDLDLRKCDVTDRDQVEAVVREFRPTVILHSAAERRPAVVTVQEEKTKTLNVLATQILCELAQEVGAYVLFISTGAVFDGSEPPYFPTDPPNPVSRYGISKAEGEKAVMESSPDNVVLRVPLLFGKVESLDESSVTSLLLKVKNSGTPALIDHRKQRFPTWTLDLANAVKILVDARSQNPELTGYFHWSGAEMMTKYEMSMAMAEVFGMRCSHIEAVTDGHQHQHRQFINSHLVSRRMETLAGATKRTPFKIAIKECLKDFIV